MRMMPLLPPRPAPEEQPARHWGDERRRHCHSADALSAVLCPLQGEGRGRPCLQALPPAALQLAPPRSCRHPAGSAVAVPRPPGAEGPRHGCHHWRWWWWCGLEGRCWPPGVRALHQQRPPQLLERRMLTARGGRMSPVHGGHSSSGGARHSNRLSVQGGKARGFRGSVIGSLAG